MTAQGLKGDYEAAGGVYCIHIQRTGRQRLLILLLPAAAGADAIWLAMPITELLTATYAVCVIMRYTKQLPQPIPAVYADLPA